MYAHPLSRDLRPQLVRIRPPLAQGTPPVIDPTNPAFGQIIKLSKAAPLWATQPPSLHFPGTAFAPQITLVRIWAGFPSPVVAFSASRGPQQPVPEERGVRPNRGEGNLRVEAGSRVSDAHPAPWVPHPQRGLAGKSRAGCDGGRWGGPGARDARAGRKERAVGSEEGWGGWGWARGPGLRCRFGEGERGSGRQRLESATQRGRRSRGGEVSGGQYPASSAAAALSNCSWRNFWQS